MQCRELKLRCGYSAQIKARLKFQFQPSHRCSNYDGACSRTPCEPPSNADEFGAGCDPVPRSVGAGADDEAPVDTVRTQPLALLPAPLFESPSPERWSRTCLSSKPLRVFSFFERVTQTPNSSSNARDAQARLTRAAFSLATFFWPRKRK